MTKKMRCIAVSFSISSCLVNNGTAQKRDMDKDIDYILQLTLGYDEWDVNDKWGM
jgi:hypothetical protein